MLTKHSPMNSRKDTTFIDSLSFPSRLLPFLCTSCQYPGTLSYRVPNGHTLWGHRQVIFVILPVIHYYFSRLTLSHVTVCCQVSLPTHYLHSPGIPPLVQIQLSSFLLTVTAFPSLSFPSCYINHQYSETHSTKDSQKPHWTGTQVGDSHCPSISTLHYDQIYSWLYSSLISAAPTAFPGDSRSYWRSRISLALSFLSHRIYFLSQCTLHAGVPPPTTPLLPGGSTTWNMDPLPPAHSHSPSPLFLHPISIYQTDL